MAFTFPLRTGRPRARDGGTVGREHAPDAAQRVSQTALGGGGEESISSLILFFYLHCRSRMVMFSVAFDSLFVCLLSSSIVNICYLNK